MSALQNHDIISQESKNEKDDMTIKKNELINQNLNKDNKINIKFNFNSEIINNNINLDIQPLLKDKSSDLVKINK